MNDKKKNENSAVGISDVAENTSLPSSGALPRVALPVKEGTKDERGGDLKPLPPQVYDAAGDIKKFGLKPTEMLEYKDPFSGTVKKIMIDRRGTSDEKLALALLDDKVNRDQKDTMISMYLFEKGKQGASMLMDLWTYKGTHTKESRAFQSNMRFDFELYMQAFQMYLQDSADKVFDALPIEVVTVDVEEDVNGKKVTKQKEIVKIKEGGTGGINALEPILLTLGELARYQRMTATLLSIRIRAEVDKRERAKGKGIYIGMDMKPYSVFEDGDIVEKVSKDRDTAKEMLKDKEKTAERVKAGQCVRCDRQANHDSLYCPDHEPKDI